MVRADESCGRQLMISACPIRGHQSHGRESGGHLVCSGQHGVQSPFPGWWKNFRAVQVDAGNRWGVDVAALDSAGDCDVDQNVANAGRVAREVVPPGKECRHRGKYEPRQFERVSKNRAQRK
jgi:hypothetical protein